MKNIYRFLFALLFLGIFQSCSLKEMYDPTSPENDNNIIEFIARPLGYNNQPVETKSAANDFENAIYSCYLLVFDNDEHSLNYGNLIQMTEASLNENIRLEACLHIRSSPSFQPYIFI